MTKLPKYMEDAFKRMIWPALLVVKEKHVSFYLLIEDRESLYREALTIVKRRKEDTYSDPGGAELDPMMDALDLAALPDSLRADAERAKKQHERDKKKHAEDVKQWEQINEAIAGNDGALAWMVLAQRSSCEYEEVELRSFDNKKSKR